MRKRVFIPTVILGRETEGDLLELSVEPGGFFCNDEYDALRDCHMEKAIFAARQALLALPGRRRKNQIHLVNPTPYLSNSIGAAFGLVLAAFICDKQCTYQSLIVTGVLGNQNADGDILITDSGQFNSRLLAVLSMGWQDQPTLFVMSSQTELQSDIISKLLKFNIYVRQVHSLREALDYCLTPLAENPNVQGI